MPTTKDKLTRSQLADTQRLFPAPGRAPAPARGWARAIRESLGMGQAQLAVKLGVSRQ